jgi:hypothetical protein
VATLIGSCLPLMHVPWMRSFPQHPIGMLVCWFSVSKQMYVGVVIVNKNNAELTI